MCSWLVWDSLLHQSNLGLTDLYLPWPLPLVISCEKQISIVLTPHQGNIPLHVSERVTELHNPSKCRGVEHRPRGYIYNTAPAPKAQGSLCKREGKMIRARGTGSFLSPKKMSHQHGCLNVT